MKPTEKTSGLFMAMIAFLASACAALFACPARAEVIDGLGVDKVALTFDACETKTPSYFDEKILSFLVEQKIPFTVFMTGKFAKRNSVRLKEISKLPFVEIENHSFSHRQHMERMSEADIKKEVTRLDDMVKRMTGRRTRFFRFPAGNCDERSVKAVEKMGYKVVAWSFESGDPNKAMTTQKLVDRVTSRTRPGSILIFHINGRGYCTGEALPTILQNLRDEGLEFVKLEDGGL